MEFNFIVQTIIWIITLKIVTIQFTGGNLASAYDIAINTDFFNKIDTNLLFKKFVISVVNEGIEDKYKLQFDREYDVGEIF